MPVYPDTPDLLRAVASFLRQEIRPALARDPRDRGLRFRALIAAHLVERLADEVPVARELERAELASLRQLLGHSEEHASTSPTELPPLRARLARDIRAGRFSDRERAADVRRHLLRTMGARLAVQSPDFERALDL